MSKVGHITDLMSRLLMETMTVFRDRRDLLIVKIIEGPTSLNDFTEVTVSSRSDLSNLMDSWGCVMVDISVVLTVVREFLSMNWHVSWVNEVLGCGNSSNGSDSESSHVKDCSKLDCLNYYNLSEIKYLLPSIIFTYGVLGFWGSGFALSRLRAQGSVI